jgi:hypothetical protein
MSYEQINKDDLNSASASGNTEEHAARPTSGRRSSSGKWFGWGSGAESREKTD